MVCASGRKKLVTGDREISGIIHAYLLSPVTTQLVHNELVCELREDPVCHWDIIWEGNDFTVGWLKFTDVVSPVWASNAFARAAQWQVVLIAPDNKSHNQGE